MILRVGRIYRPWEGYYEDATLPIRSWRGIRVPIELWIMDDMRELWRHLLPLHFWPCILESDTGILQSGAIRVMIKGSFAHLPRSDEHGEAYSEWIQEQAKMLGYAIGHMGGAIRRASMSVTDVDVLPLVINLNETVFAHGLCSAKLAYHYLTIPQKVWAVQHGWTPVLNQWSSTRSESNLFPTGDRSRPFRAFFASNYIRFPPYLRDDLTCQDPWTCKRDGNNTCE